MTTTAQRYIVMTATAKVPTSCRGTYRRVAVVELDGTGVKPAMISEHARGVARIVRTWERRSVGLTDRCAYRVALREAEALVAELEGAA